MSHFEGFSPEKCKLLSGRYEGCQLFDEFINKDQAFQNLYLCHEVVGNIVVSYFDDIDRLKRYHATIKLADQHKIAAFTAKWITCLKPIQIIEGQLTHTKDVKLLANEYFAFYAITSILQISNVKNIPESLRYNMLYMFRYRHL